MKKSFYMLFITILFHNISFSQKQDSIITYKLKEITVFGKKYSIDQNEFPVEKDNLSDVLQLGGFSIIRKGVFLAQDIYADGLKRGDYTIVVDGERYHNACPMRMDAPITRINPIEVKSIEIVKSSSNLQSGLGGIIEVNRSTPTRNFGIAGNLTQMLGNINETDFSLLTEKYNQRISLRYDQGVPYRTGDDKTFKDLYGYKENKKFQFGEVSYNGVIEDWNYTGSLMYSENVSFPYLQMDEIKSTVYNSSLSYKSYKIYFNYTDHLMDNGLRESNMIMETAARNLTLGFVSDLFEMYYRHWDADNNMRMMNGSMPVYNHILPKINLYSVNVFRKAELLGLQVSGKIGLSYYNVGDKEVIDFYDQIHPDAKSNRVFPLVGINISRTELITNSFSISGMIDFAAEAPEAEALYVNVKRMMGKPYWSGNPDLDQPIRTTLRTNLSIPNVSLDLFGSYIFNYVYLASAISGMQKYQTFGNVNALILGADLKLTYNFLESEVSYTYGENESNHQPLIEILPLHISNRLNLPEVYNIKLYIRHTYENAQKRVDPGLLEAASGAWNRIDLGMNVDYGKFIIGFSAENILNVTYSKHLSYVRDPFSSGMKVIEPGLSFRLNLRYGN